MTSIAKCFRCFGLMSVLFLLSANGHVLVSSGADNATHQSGPEAPETSNAEDSPALLVFDEDPGTPFNHQMEPVHQASSSSPKPFQLDLNKKVDWDAFRLQALDTQNIKIGPAKSKPAEVASGFFGIESVPAVESAAPVAPPPAAINATAAGAANGTSLTVAEIPLAMTPLSSKDILSQFL